MSEYSALQIEVVDDYLALSQAAASQIVAKLTETPNMSLLVPTGTTPEATYAILSEQPADLFEEVTFFNMDEYCEPDGDHSFKMIEPSHPQSYKNYMDRHILRAQPAIVSRFPDLKDTERPGSYDELIEAHGGIDLCVTAIGEDGHTFGFNFPGTPVDSVTRLVEVNESTQAVNQKLTGAPVPEHAITTGLATGMAAKEVLVLVSGARKAAILKRVLHGEVSPEVPATILHDHPNCKWLIDQAAASQL